MLRIIPLGLVLALLACDSGDAAGRGTVADGAVSLDASAAGGSSGALDASDVDDVVVDAGTDAGGFRNLGVCGQRSEGTVTADDYDAHEELYLTGDEGFGEDLCVVRFDVTRAGAAPAGCDDFAGQQQECLWAHLVEYGNASIVRDVDGACANSELALTAAAIAELEGQQIAYGYVFEYQGHDSVLMVYDYETAAWDAVVNAGWDEASGAFRFDRRNGFCGY